MARATRTTGYQSTWDVTRAQHGHAGILVDYTGGRRHRQHSCNQATRRPSTRSRSTRATFLQQTEPRVPGITAVERPRDAGRSAEVAAAQGSTRTGRPGSTRILGLRGCADSAACTSAGEHCSINFQGFMEGGAEEGARAAGEILSDYKAGIFP